MWRKPVEGFPMRAVKFKGLVDMHGLGMRDMWALMSDLGCRRELSKSTPSPIAVSEVVETIEQTHGGQRLRVTVFYEESKFPWPLSNRHACFASCSRLCADGVSRISCEATIDHEIAVQRAGRSGVIWRYVNTAMLEEQNGKVAITFSSLFDISGDIPLSLMDNLLESMGDVYSNWEKLIVRRPPVATEALIRGAPPDLEPDPDHSSSRARRYRRRRRWSRPTCCR